MTSLQIRQTFLDFFKSRQHTIVPSSSLLPDSPNLLFTNAGMNQFVPIFLGQAKCPYAPGRAADTQKCIRAGGKHNDLEDVGLDTYHHTFFEMLGNWSFGDYFKKEAIEWAWQLVVNGWGFPAERLYATVFCPYRDGPDWEKKWQTELEQVLALAMTSPDFIPPDANASPFEIADQEAAMHWAKKFTAAGLDPKTHIIPGGKKDNFWMMGETGPCGPCSELHVDLTPNGDTRGKLVNAGSPQCIEIWNLVFIQFNANPDGTFSPLPARHVDTGMGFERVTAIIQGTNRFKDFANANISNYETDIFRPLFDQLEKLSGKKYGSTLPDSSLQPATLNPQVAIDIAFRVIADHVRTLGFAIADGIQPSNEGRGYVLRRILRRAVRYGRALGFHEPFLYKLVEVLAETMGEVFPEIVATQNHVQEIINAEEEAFNKTLDRGIVIFENDAFASAIAFAASNEGYKVFKIGKTGIVPIGDEYLLTGEIEFKRKEKSVAKFTQDELLAGAWRQVIKSTPIIFGHDAFKLYDTYGFPLDLTELMARERGLTVDKEGFEKLMEEQRARARASQKKEVIELAGILKGKGELKGTLTVADLQTTKFIGYEKLETPAKVLEVVSLKEKTAVVLDTSPFYAEMGGQVGDTGELQSGSQQLRIANTQKSGNTWLHIVEGGVPAVGANVTLAVEKPRREAIQRHHTVTHLLHWALHEVVSKDVSQKGSFVGPDKLTFDFNSQPLTPQQVSNIEKLVNERILENAGVSWTEVPYADVKPRKDVMQFFGEKYGDTVRVVQIGGRAGLLNGYSMELCGGTHTRATGEIGLFRIVSENAIAAGVRRIEAVAGLEAYHRVNNELHLIRTLAGKVNSPVHELDKKVESLLAHQRELEKQVKSAQQREASNAASLLLEEVKIINGLPSIIHNLGAADGDFLQAIADSLKGRFKGVIILGGVAGGAVALLAAVSPEFVNNVQAGKIIQQIAPIVGGKGGGRPDNARGGGKDVNKLSEALAKAEELLNG